MSSAASLDPTLPEAHSLLAVAFAQKGLPQAAQNSFEQALRLRPKDPETLNNFGYWLFKRGDNHKAAEYFKRATKQAPAERRYWNNLALAQSLMDKFDDAFKSFVRAGGEFKGRMNVANVLERAGRDREALKHYEAARQLDPASRDLLQHLADVYQRLGRPVEAETARQALAAQAQQNAQAGGVK